MWSSACGSSGTSSEGGVGELGGVGRHRGCGEVGADALGGDEGGQHVGVVIAFGNQPRQPVAIFVDESNKFPEIVKYEFQEEETQE